MLRRDLLKILGLSFVPLPGLVLGPPTHARIAMSFEGQVVAEAPIDFRLNSVMKFTLECIDQELTFDGCELYRDGDSEPFLQHVFLPLHLTPGCNLELAWDVKAESRRGDSNPTQLGV